ncbi:RNA recognition motif domain-containing protein [Luteolibacter marinus]|uniref:RNA recognition motif domain-containing protein n=1 Tax=Luteolibacter marinus TaxID=2776705 RepID=UPI0018693C0C|nr:RNA-binding protein [Luteolibacter marinus]
MKIYVCNLSVQARRQELEELFSRHGKVTALHMPADSRCASVTMDGAEAMQAAIEALDGHLLHGRKLKVTEARPREESDHAANPTVPVE